MAAVEHAQSVDQLDRLEVYIPVEAEVKSIPLWSLPNSVLRRMSLPRSDSEGPRRLAESPQGIWICPAVLRRKGQKMPPQPGVSAAENMSSLVSTVAQAGKVPVRMSFVSSNRAAYKVLKNCVPGREVSAETPPLPPGSAPQTYHHAVIIYHGCIFLSIRKPKRGPRQRKTAKPQPASLSASAPTPGVSSENCRKELLNIHRLKKKATTCTVMRSENWRGVTHQGGAVSPSQPACPVPQSADSTRRPDSHHQGAAGGEQDLVSEQAESTNQNNDMDSNVVIDSTVGIIEQSSSQRWSSRDYEGAAGASTSPYLGFDYKELEHQEELNLIKAKLKAANDNLQKKVRVNSNNNC